MMPRLLNSSSPAPNLSWHQLHAFNDHQAPVRPRTFAVLAWRSLGTSVVGAVLTRPPKMGMPQRNYDRYVALACDAALNGDPFKAENFYQHAGHYFRVLRGQ
jgi:hypothetical protein